MMTDQAGIVAVEVFGKVVLPVTARRGDAAGSNSDRI
jgi:hypothetical protein